MELSNLLNIISNSNVTNENINTNIVSELSPPSVTDATMNYAPPSNIIEAIEKGEQLYNEQPTTNLQNVTSQPSNVITSNNIENVTQLPPQQQNNVTNQMEITQEEPTSSNTVINQWGRGKGVKDIKMNNKTCTLKRGRKRSRSRSRSRSSSRSRSRSSSRSRSRRKKISKFPVMKRRSSPRPSISSSSSGSDDNSDNNNSGDEEENQQQQQHSRGRGRGRGRGRSNGRGISRRRSSSVSSTNRRSKTKKRRSSSVSSTNRRGKTRKRRSSSANNGPKRRPGRPKGSLNKVKMNPVVLTDPVTDIPIGKLKCQVDGYTKQEKNILLKSYNDVKLDDPLTEGKLTSDCSKTLLQSTFKK